MPDAQVGIVRGPETYPLLGHLQSSDRIVITGASGWMGRSLLHELEAALGDAMTTQVLALGSRARTVHLGSGRPIHVMPWEHDSVAEWQPTACVHLAYITRDHVGDARLDEFIEGNLRLTARAARLQQLPGLRAFVTSSSGAALTLDWAEAVSDRQVYGYLKRLDEAFFAKEGDRLGVPTVIARTWSVSGPYCTKPHLFAFSDLIRQAHDGMRIEVTSTHEVWRRYLDAGQYLATCLRACIEGESSVIDSEGPLVEVGSLAALVAEVTGAAYSPRSIESGLGRNVYATDQGRFTSLANAQETRLLNLHEQVLFTSQGLIGGWGVSGSARAQS